MKHTLQEKRERNWFRLSLVHTRSRLITTAAYLVMLGLLSIVSLMLEHVRHGAGVWVWLYLAIGFSSATILPFFSARSITQNFHTRAVDINSSEFRGIRRIISYITRVKRPRVRLHWGCGSYVVCVFSCGIPSLPMHLVLKGIKADEISTKELIAIIAHEFGHIYLGNVVVLNTIRSIVASPMLFAIWLGWLTPLSNKIPQKWPRLTIPHLVCAWSTVWVLVPIALILFYAGIGLSRVFFSVAHYFEEYTADSSAYAIQGTGKRMASLLNKMYCAVSIGGQVNPYNWFKIVRLDIHAIAYNAIAFYPSLPNRIRTLQWLEST